MIRSRACARRRQRTAGACRCSAHASAQDINSSRAACVTAADCARRPLEATVKSGEVLFIPSGWWHCCLNLGPINIAVTQNYAPPCCARRVLAYLRARGEGAGDVGELVSGVPGPLRAEMAEKFAEVLREHCPEALDADADADAAHPPDGAPAAAEPDAPGGLVGVAAGAAADFRFSFT